MLISSENLKVGDTLVTAWRGHNSTIHHFEEYNGCFDFILKIAVFADGARMSIEKGHSYECI